MNFGLIRAKEYPVLSSFAERLSRDVPRAVDIISAYRRLNSRCLKGQIPNRFVSLSQCRASCCQAVRIQSPSRLYSAFCGERRTQKYRETIQALIEVENVISLTSGRSPRCTHSCYLNRHQLPGQPEHAACSRRQKKVLDTWRRDVRADDVCAYPLTSAAKGGIHALSSRDDSSRFLLYVSAYTMETRPRRGGGDHGGTHRYYCLSICPRRGSARANAEGKRPDAIESRRDTRYVCVRCSGERVRTASESWRYALGTLNLRIVKVSIIALALPYFSYGKLYRVVS